MPAWLEPTLERLVTAKGHAWLLTGAAGLGQWDVALMAAKSWLCETPRSNRYACGQCASCHLVDVKSHLDLAVLMPETVALAMGWPLDEKSQDEIDSKKRKPSKEIRIDALRSVIGFAERTAGRGRGLVVLIYPAQTMNAFAATALLKTLEEPPGDVKFVLASDAAGDLLPTIRSRCQQIQIQPSSLDAFAQKGRAMGALDVFFKSLPQGAVPADVPDSLKESPSALITALQMLAVDLLHTAYGREPLYFTPAQLPAIKPSVSKLTQWQQSLRKAQAVSDHPLNASLMLEALLAQAKEALNSRL